MVTSTPEQAISRQQAGKGYAAVFSRPRASRSECPREGALRQDFQASVLTKGAKAVALVLRMTAISCGYDD